MWRFQSGDAFYANRLRVFTTTDLSPEDIHEAGLANVERLHGEMRTMVELGEGELRISDRVRKTQASLSQYRDGALIISAARMAIDAMAEKLPNTLVCCPEQN